MTFNGLMVFDVTAEDGFHERGPAPARRDDHAVRQLLRRLRLLVERPQLGRAPEHHHGGLRYSVAADRIQVAHLDSLGEPVASWRSRSPSQIRGIRLVISRPARDPLHPSSRLPPGLDQP